MLQLGLISPDSQDLLEDGVFPRDNVRTLNTSEWNLPEVAFLVLGKILGHQTVAHRRLHVERKQSPLHLQHPLIQGHEVVRSIPVKNAFLVQIALLWIR